jgi:hypothetical protein
LAAPWQQLGNTFFFCQYLKEHGGKQARGVFNTWWSDPPPIEPQLPHIADCAWTVGRLTHMPPELAKLVAVAQEARHKPLQNLPAGPFRREIRLTLEEGGHFFSDGLIEFRPTSEGFGVKAGRRGYVDFRFAARRGTFQRFVVRPWFRNLGSNAVLIQPGSTKTDAWLPLGENQDWQGEPLDATDRVRGRQDFFLRFQIESRPDLPGVTPCLARFVVEGEIAFEPRT